jgi:hypothetical protein
MFLQWIKNYTTNNEKAITFPDSPYSVENQVAILQVDTTGGAVTIDLQEIGSEYNRDYRLVVIDSGNASVNNITINRAGADLINGSTSLVVSTNGEKVEIGILDQTNYYANTY